MEIKYAIIGVNAYITPEFDAVDILIPTRKKNWLTGIHNAPNITRYKISFLSILNDIPLTLKKIKSKTVANPNLKKARDRGEISAVTYFAATGVKPAENVRYKTVKNFFKVD